MTKYAEFYHRRVAAGQCVKCAQPAKGGACEDCRGDQRERMNRRYTERRARGLCVRCEAPAGDKSMCLKCRLKKCAYINRWRQQQREAA